MLNIAFEMSCFMGKQRAGKTMSMIKEGEEIFISIKTQESELLRKLKKDKKLTRFEEKRLEIFKNFEIMSNLNLNKAIFGNYKQMTTTDLIKMYLKKESIKNKLILFDDFFKTVDNRKSMNSEEIDGEKVNLNMVYSYFFTEIGKKQNILLYVSHFSNNVELRLRNMTENFIWCKKGTFKTFKQFPKIKVFFELGDYYKLAETEQESNEIIIKEMLFKEYFDFANPREMSEKKLEKIEYYKASDYFNHYDTGEIV